MIRTIGHIALLVLAVMVIYVAVLFTTASIALTHHGTIRWDKGWQAVLETLGRRG